jgi:Flp pilus assembly protein TadG
VRLQSVVGGSARGNSMAWMAIIMAFLMVPLMGLTMDVTRAMYVRTHLQAATDAGCQAAADSMHVTLFQNTGMRQINASLMYGRAAQVFNATLTDSGKVRFSPALGLRLLTATSVECTATASVERLIPVIVPEMNLTVRTVSDMRARTQP